MYVVRKYIKAVSVGEALKKERAAPVHEIYVDENWQKNHLPEAIGFNYQKDETEEET